jgi:hypothetical protein
VVKCRSVDGLWCRADDRSWLGSLAAAILWSKLGIALTRKSFLELAGGVILGGGLLNTLACSTAPSAACSGCCS